MHAALLDCHVQPGAVLVMNGRTRKNTSPSNVIMYEKTKGQNKWTTAQHSTCTYSYSIDWSWMDRSFKLLSSPPSFFIPRTKDTGLRSAGLAWVWLLSLSFFLSFFVVCCLLSVCCLVTIVVRSMSKPKSRYPPQTALSPAGWSYRYIYQKEDFYLRRMGRRCLIKWSPLGQNQNKCRTFW